MLRTTIGAFAAATALASIGVVAAAVPAQAATGTTTVVKVAAAPSVWVDYGVYPNRSECSDVGAYLVQQGFYLNYACNRRSNGTYLLRVLDY